MRSQAAQTGAAGGEEITAARLWLVLARASASVGTFIERSMGLKGFCLTDFMILEAFATQGVDDDLGYRRKSPSG